MQRKDSRWIQFHDLKLRPYRNIPTDTEIDLRVLVEPLRRLFDSGKAVWYIKSGNAGCRILDIRYDEQGAVLILLLQYADSDLPDPSFGNKITGKVRIEPKSTEEGIAVSAHMLISLNRINGDSRYLSLIEAVPGLGRTRIEDFLTYLFKEISEDNFPYKNSAGEAKSSRPIVELLGHPSDSLREALETGILKEIQLSRHERIDEQLDQVDYSEEKLNRLRIVPSNGFVFGDAMNLIKNQMLRAKQDAYSEMRIKYKDTRTGKQETIPVDLSADDFEDTLFTKREKIRLDQPVNSCVETIHDDIIEQMFELLAKMSS